MKYKFETSHTTESVRLTLHDGTGGAVWFADFERFQAQSLADMLANGGGPSTVTAGSYRVNVMRDGERNVLVLVGDDGPYLRFKILLTMEQAADLASTVQIHVIASEYDGRPKDELGPRPPDDLRPSGWSPDKERQQYGVDGDDSDPADFWKKG